jgi:hypothetical protein
MPVLAWGAEWTVGKNVAKYVRIEGDRLIVDVPAGVTNINAYATRPIDLSDFSQSVLEAHVRCRGEDVVRDLRFGRGVKLSLHYDEPSVGEFSACIYAPGAGQYLRDCISIFEEYGWDWSYHSFREALWWNVETVIDPKIGKPVPNKDNDRFRALVDGFNFNAQ